MCATLIVLQLGGILHSDRLKIASDFVFLALLVIQFLLPSRYEILGIIAILTGFINIYFGGRILGFLYYRFGYSIFMKRGWFREKTIAKTSVLVAILAAGLLHQLSLKNGSQRFIVSLVNIAVASLIMTGFLILFGGNMRGFFTTLQPLDLSAFKLSERQKRCVLGCQDRKRIKEIADEVHISESVIKKEFLELYAFSARRIIIRSTLSSPAGSSFSRVPSPSQGRKRKRSR